MKVTWNGHACFTLEMDGTTVVLDPYLDNYVPGVGCVNATADAVFCSHGHNDHKAAEVVKLTGRTPSIDVEELHTFHDPEGGALRGTNIIHLFRAEGMKVAHFGDLGCDPAPELKEKLMNLDVMMIPVGGFYTIDAPAAVRVAELLQARVVLPMHYKTSANASWPIAGVEAYTALCGEPVEFLNLLRVTAGDLACQPASAVLKPQSIQ